MTNTDPLRNSVPLSAGDMSYARINQYEAVNIFRIAAKEGASLALDEFRLSRKAGRDDKGTGDPGIGAIVRNRREMLGLTQADLASHAGIHYTTVGKIETGDRGMSLQTFCKLGRWLGPSFVGAVVDYVSDGSE